MKNAWKPHRGVIAVVAAGVFQTVVFPGVAQAGFFDELFGHLFGAPSYRGYAAYPPQGPSWGSDRGFRRRGSHGGHKQWHNSAARRKMIVAERADHPMRPQGPVDIMEDDSLRKGDAVMTPAGIRIFVGSSGDHHVPEDFREPSQIKGLSKFVRKAFAALDAGGSAIDGKPRMAMGRSASEPKLTAGEAIKDFAGRTIRYVGP
jgi:hypothetical protein